MWRWVLALVVTAVTVAGCGDREGTATNGGRAARSGGEAAETEGPRVVVSIFPLGSLAAQVVGETGEVDVLLPAGRSPHAFELTVQQVRTLAEADVVVIAGGGIDQWAEDAAARFVDRVRIIDVQEVVREAAEQAKAKHEDASGMGGQADQDDAPGHAGHDAAANAHHWLDPKRAADFVSYLGTELARDFPAHSDALLANTEHVLATILEVDAAYRTRLRDVKRRELVTFHNAFDLLTQRYDLDVVAHLTPIELTPAGEVTPARLQTAVEQIERHKLAVIYAEPQFPDTAVAALREHVGVAVLRLDPLGDPRREGYDTWQAMMNSNLETLVEGQNR